MIWPIDKVHITQEFGKNPHIYQRFGLAGHNGIDFRTRFVDSLKGKRPILAALDGRVIEIQDQGGVGYGKFVRLQHKGKSQTIYAHLSKFLVEEGDKIKQGDMLGISGNTGFSTGPHLHFGYRPVGWTKNYQNGFKGYVDPLPFLEGKKQEKKEEVDSKFAKKWAGWMIIVPEMNGQVYYVNPKTLKRYPISTIRSDEAALFARDGAWVGMSYTDVTKIPEA